MPITSTRARTSASSSSRSSPPAPTWSWGRGRSNPSRISRRSKNCSSASGAAWSAGWRTPPGRAPSPAAAPHPPRKSLLQRRGRGVVRRLAHPAVPDATSGFRAYSREAALRLTVLTGFPYTLETLIQASQKNIAIAHVPIRVNGKLRESRLFRGMGSYVTRSLGTMARISLLYQPLRFFLTLAVVFAAGALALFVRFLVAYFTTVGPTGHVQSLTVAGALAIIATLFGALGVIADLSAMNRLLLEEIVVNTRMQLIHAGRERPQASP